jgi:hypothetical protein
MLSGYAGRSGLPESTAVQENIFAQAAAFGSGADTSLLITVDSTGVPDNVIDPLAIKLSQNYGISRDRIVIASTHSHSAPQLAGYLPNLFSPPLSAGKQQDVDAYTSAMSGWLESVAISALNNRTPGHSISWGTGSANFGENRRGEGVNDRDLPVMLVKDSAGQPSAVIATYGTHATTLDAGDNLVSGDWPGYARDAIESMYPGATALVMIGGGADSDPAVRGTVAAAQSHGQDFANEVQRLINQNLLKPISPQISSASHTEINLNFATQRIAGDPPTARLAPAAGSTPYGITSWTFGHDLAMVFLEGELVADYSLRLKAELGDKLWVNGYSNDVQGYIPSERVLYAGGYEPDDSGFYYGLPGRFAHGLEDKIVGAVHDQLGGFVSVSDHLRLNVNWATGDIAIANKGNRTIAIDGYTIAAPGGNLLTANGAWNSFQDQGLSGWDQADNSSSLRLTEFNPTSSTTFAPGASRSIGRPFLPSPPVKFGDAASASTLTFSYSIAGGEIETGTITSAPINNLVLTIDPHTGEAAIRNASPFFDAAITAYTITSASGLLKTSNGNWNSLQDQGLPGWDQADNASATRLTEFKTSGAMTLAKNTGFLVLGSPVDVTGNLPSASDFIFEFLLGSGQVLQGVVQLGSIAVTGHGDYDGDGDVDGADFLKWQRTAGGAVAPVGSAADGNNNGVVDTADLSVWRAAFTGTSTVAVLTPTPEPTAFVLCCFVIAVASRYAAASRLRSLAELGLPRLPNWFPAS